MKELNGVLLPDCFYEYLVQVSTNYIYRVNNSTVFYYDGTVIKYGKNNETSENARDDEDDEEDEDEYKINVDKVCINNFELPKTTTTLSYFFPEISMSETDLIRPGLNPIHIDNVSCNFLQISSGNFDMFPHYIYLGKGPHFGSIWLDDDDSTYCECPTYSKQFDTFASFFDHVNALKNKQFDENDFQYFEYGGF